MYPFYDFTIGVKDIVKEHINLYRSVNPARMRLRNNNRQLSVYVFLARSSRKDTEN